MEIQNLPPRYESAVPMIMDPAPPDHETMAGIPKHLYNPGQRVKAAVHFSRDNSMQSEITDQDGVMLGARWEDPSQDERIKKAHKAGLIDYVEVNYPIAFGWDPASLNAPILVHTSSNPICSFHGVSPKIAQMIKEGAEDCASPWIGEHLTWLGAEKSGSLGYQINPLFTEEFKDVAVSNVKSLSEFYGRPIALELGPLYLPATGYESEIHFLKDVAIETESRIILDITHWQIANRNLGRPAEYGLDVLPKELIVELHVAGMRLGAEDNHWHDAHFVIPNDEVMGLTADLVSTLPNLRAVTFEHQADGPEKDFHQTLEKLNTLMDGARPN
jgi:uncharacterized protein (UPF0276 family)